MLLRKTHPAHLLLVKTIIEMGVDVVDHCQGGVTNPPRYGQQAPMLLDAFGYEEVPEVVWSEVLNAREVNSFLKSCPKAQGSARRILPMDEYPVMAYVDILGAAIRFEPGAAGRFLLWHRPASFSTASAALSNRLEGCREADDPIRNGETVIEKRREKGRNIGRMSF